MSFQQSLQKGGPASRPRASGPTNRPASGPEEDEPFRQKANALSVQIFKINSNVSAIEKLVSLSRDPQNKSQVTWIQRMHDLNEVTRSLAHDATASLKELAQEMNVPGPQQPGRQLAANKLQRDFEAALVRFQSAQRASAARNRDELKVAQAAHDASAETRSRPPLTENEVAQESEGTPLVDLEPAPEQAQAQVQKPTGPSQAELEFQESLIAEREAEITEIEQGIHELNEIFRDLGHIVQEQGGMVDNIEFNITNVATHTGQANRELVSAHEYQRKAGRRAFCLLIIIGVVISIVLLALLN